MTIEQTNQLILLILNSVLMTLLSSILLGGAWLRQNALLRQLHKTKSRYRKLTYSSSHSSGAEQSTDISISSQLAIQTSELKQVRENRQQLSRQYRWSRIGMLILHTTLLIFSVSLLTLALRSLLAFDSLIAIALFLFTVGAAGLLIGCGCVLIDLAKGDTSDESLGQAIAKLLQPISHQWKRKALKLGEPISRPTRVATQSRSGTVKSRGQSTRTSTGPSEKAASQ